jgi:two-component system, NarL family, response regulator
MKPLRIILADDHFIVRMGLIASLQAHPELQIVAEASRGEQAVKLYREQLPDVLLLDLRLPDISGVEVTAQITAAFPTAKIIILSSHDLEEEIFRAFKAGASGYLLKDVSVKELAAAIKSVAAGHKHIPPDIARKLAEHSPGSDLTEREMEVLQMLVKGLNNKEIGKALGCSENTAKFHIKNIFAKLRVTERTEAVTMAFQRGIIR